MAKNRVKYFVEKSGAEGPRFFWQPGKDLRAAGWKQVSLKDTEGRFLPRHMALAEAEKINDRVAGWVAGMDLTREEAATLPAGKGSVGALIDAYETGDHFLGLAKKTRKGYSWCFGVIREKLGDKPVLAMRPPDVAGFLEGFAATPVKRAHLYRVGRLLWSWGRLKSMAPASEDENPWRSQRIPDGARKQGIWTMDQIHAFVAAADKLELWSIGTAVIINHWIGQNPQDVLALQRGDYQDGRFGFVRGKTGRDVRVAHSDLVEQRIADELGRQAKRKIASSWLLVSELTGQPWKEDTFRHKFAEIRLKAAGEDEAIKDLKFFWLRHTAVTELDDAGCTTGEIASITGHSRKRVEDIIDRYGHRTEKQADAAVKKRLAAGKKRTK